MVIFNENHWNVTLEKKDNHENKNIYTFLVVEANRDITELLLFWIIDSISQGLLREKKENWQTFWQKYFSFTDGQGNRVYSHVTMKISVLQ